MSKGFTIIELIIAIAIFSMLIFLTVAMLQNVFVGSNQQFLALNNIDNARELVSRFVNQLRNAAPGVDGSYQINTAGDNQIIFYSQSATGATINRINYYLTGTTLYEGVVTPSGSPPVYNLANQVVTVVENNVVNQGPIFTYYDGNYNGSTSPLSQPVNVNSVKFVKINLTILNQVQQQSQTQFTVSAGATIRDLKNNLGN